MHWLIVNSTENFQISRVRGFDMMGFKNRWKKAAGEVRPGDTVFYYVIGKKIIAGEFAVTSESYFDESALWVCSHPGEYYPWRFKTTPTFTPGPDGGVAVADFIAEYEYARKWQANHWTLAFQGNVHRLNEHDYELIHNYLREALV